MERNLFWFKIQSLFD